MKSTSDTRDTQFAIDNVKQMGEDFGGLAVAAIDRRTRSRIEFSLTTERLSDASTTRQPAAGTLNDRWIELLGDTEAYLAQEYARAAAEIAASPTAHADLVQQAETARLTIAQVATARAALDELNAKIAERTALLAGGGT